MRRLNSVKSPHRRITSVFEKWTDSPSAFSIAYEPHEPADVPALIVVTSSPRTAIARGFGTNENWSPPLDPVCVSPTGPKYPVVPLNPPQEPSPKNSVQNELLEEPVGPGLCVCPYNLR